MGSTNERLFKLFLQTLNITLIGTFLVGCATNPANNVVTNESVRDSRKELTKQNDKIVYWSSEIYRDKPSLLLLHGATDDPAEMAGIALAWENSHNVFLFSYNHRQNVEKIAAALSAEVSQLKSENHLDKNITIIAYSYAAIVVRAAVVLTDDTTVFADASLIQLVPLAGGSRLAHWLRNPLISAMVSMASKQSVASNPYSRFAEKIWRGAGNQKFYEVIKPERVHSILLEGDSHSLENAEEDEVRAQYRNGIGTNITMIPKSAGVSHDYFPTEPHALSYLQEVLESHSDELAIHAALTNGLPTSLPEVSVAAP